MEKKDHSKNNSPSPTSIPGMDLKPDYEGKLKQPIPGQDVSEKAKKKMDETRAKLEKFKKEILKKYSFTIAMGIIPPQAADRFDEELGLSEEEKKEKPMHITMVIPEKEYKNIGKIRADLIKQSQDIKPKIWMNIITPVDLSNYSLDSKFDIVEAIAMSYPLYDKGILGAYRVSSIHKSLCLRKFEKYIYSYVIAGSLIRGEGTKTSDIDAFIIIDDTDVKRMSRMELKEKLRGIIYQYIAEASELSGSKIPLNVQVYLLTEFWESVKDVSPVIFTFIRDGLPLYDKGGFLPWKMLLKMGKITPSPESIDKFMSMGKEAKKIVNRRLIDAMVDIYWSVIYPSQALLMLYGLSPPDQKGTVREMKRIFYEKEKLLEKKYIDILEKIIIHYYKGYEHEKIKEVSGKEIDQLLKDAEDYIKKVEEVRKDVEKRTQEKTITETYDNVMKLLVNLFGKKSETALVKQFQEEIIDAGKIDPKNLHVLKELIDAKKKYKNKKDPSLYEIDDIRKNASYLINQLIEYGQRCDLADINKMRLRISYGKDKNKHAEVFLTNPGFIFLEGKIMKIGDKKIENTTQEEYENIIATQKGNPGKLTEEMKVILEKELGKFDISL